LNHLSYFINSIDGGILQVLRSF